MKKQTKDADYESDAEEENHAPENKEAQAQLEGLKLDQLIKVELKLGQTPIVAADNDQPQTMLVHIQENTLEEEHLSQASLDLVCVIDCSGSMNGFKLTQVQQTLVYVMEMLQPTDRLALVAFNSQAVILNSLRLASKENKCGRLLSNVQSLTAIGGTNIVAGLKKAHRILAQRTTKNRVASVFLLSDGNDNFDLEGLEPVLSDLRKLNVSVNAFGYGEDHDPDCLRKMAEENRGNFYFIKDLSRVDESFVDCLALLTSAIGSKAKIDVKLLPTPFFKEISFKQCYGNAWHGESDTSRTIELGNVYVGMDKTFVSDIVLDKCPGVASPVEVKIAECKITLGHLGTSQEIVLNQDLIVKVVPADLGVEVVKDPEVEKHLLRVTGASVLNTARRLLDKGKIEDAEKVFETFRSRIGKVTVNDVVLDNLAKQACVGQQYFAQMKPYAGDSKYREKEQVARRDFGHYLNQQENIFMNEQSAPEWNCDMYQNTRQKRFMNILSKLK